MQLVDKHILVKHLFNFNQLQNHKTNMSEQNYYKSNNFKWKSNGLIKLVRKQDQ